MFSMELTGQDEATRWFSTKSAQLIPMVTPHFLNTGRKVMRILSEYPAQPTSSRYVRTGTLGRRNQMRHTVMPLRIAVNVYNMTSYAPYVLNTAAQASHLRHWTNTDTRVLKRVRPQLIEEVSGALIRGLR